MNRAGNYKYVWLNMNTGEFSNSWDEDTHERVSTSILDDKSIQRAKEHNWKLIKYHNILDEDFEFYNKMKIVTNNK